MRVFCGMKDVRLNGAFRKDPKKITKRGWDRKKLDTIVGLLRAAKPLPVVARTHKLSGIYAGRWECHIESDWILIYDFTETLLRLVRTGTHADLFE